MKIGLFTPSWPGHVDANGITTAVANLVDGIEALGHDAIILTRRIDGNSQTIAIELPSPRAWSFYERANFKFGRDIATIPVFKEQLLSAARKAAEIHSLDVFVIEETQGLASALSNNLSIPVVVVLHGPWFILKNWQTHAVDTSINQGRDGREKEALDQCAGIISPSQDVLQKSISEYHLRDTPHRVIPNAISPKCCINYDTLTEKEMRSILFVGRTDWIKGGDLVLSAFKQLIEDRVDCYLTFVGPDFGYGRNSTKTISDAQSELPSKVQARIDYKGKCEKTVIDQLRRKHGICLVASRYENFPLAVLESCATGVATIATDTGGIPEIIQDGKTGLLAESGNAKSIAQACHKLIADPQLCGALGNAARQDVIERFSPQIVASQFISFLEREVIKT